MPSEHAKLIVSSPETERIIEDRGGNRSQVLRLALERYDWLMRTAQVPELDDTDREALCLLIGDRELTTDEIEALPQALMEATEDGTFTSGKIKQRHTKAETALIVRAGYLAVRLRGADPVVLCAVVDEIERSG